MSQIKLTPAELVASAAKYKQGSQNITETLQMLTREQETIRSNWDGAAFRSFDDQFQALTPKIQEFSQLLEDIDMQLKKVAEIVEQTDRDIASQING
ncbi:WXG100 family type VII secretion target [uncultured Vagococcus sp.]|uniref:WXG100 family type VII secretion target n=1 Tax=uncultured Vagococcus sp. TaxID=189676 RepID=UPI0028D00270|nr:WXG100 family type VII secretion target [uncultured Vagococcus sp.]